MAQRDVHANAMNPDAVLPGAGRVWLADFGSEGPWGRFAVEVGPQLFIVRWYQPTHGGPK
jgi:hypothetical protein